MVTSAHNRPALIEALSALIATLREDPNAPSDDLWIVRFCRERNCGVSDVSLHVKKRALLPCYWEVKAHDPDLWRSWDVSPELEARLVSVLQAKPRRTASGVATVTVITKPWPCSGTCRFCPNDLRMPKSYISDEPACQRAEQCLFDPYLQVSGRIQVLAQMGHPIDKVELIVLGGTWTDYPEAYRRWFAAELFRALNDGVGDEASKAREQRREAYRAVGFSIEQTEDAPAPSDELMALQGLVNDGQMTYNQAWPQLYGPRTPWDAVSKWQVATPQQLVAVQRANESAACRCVGLSFETRPDRITPEVLWSLRELGCTKVQIGVQSTKADHLRSSDRQAEDASTQRAFQLLRLFGFKIQAHQMANLPGASLDMDRRDYRRLVNDPRFEPDEVKLYPCALIDGTGLVRDFEAGVWHPYQQKDLVGLLADDIAATPRWVRVSRMIRDFSAEDILAGNRQANLRQEVEGLLHDSAMPTQEIRFREVALSHERSPELRLRTWRYFTTVSEERFLEWSAPDETIHGFLRLSLPVLPAVLQSPSSPASPDGAMIREVHVYGRVARLNHEGVWSQHRGLGRALVEEACRQAAQDGRSSIAVISAVGTREYYRSLGFEDDGLYQRRQLA